MSHWGILLCALYVIIYIKKINNLIKNNENNKKLKSYLTYTPLHKDFISILYGSLLGNGNCYGEKRDIKTRFIFYQENIHKEYLLYYYNLINQFGLCSNNLPIIKNKLVSKGKIKKFIKFNTWSYIKLNWIYNNWYKNNIKILPYDIEYYFTPLTLAILIMNNGIKINKGLKIITDNFNYEEHIKLKNILYNKYNLNISIHKIINKNNIKYSLYIYPNSIDKLYLIIQPYLISSMKYKLIN